MVGCSNGGCPVSGGVMNKRDGGSVLVNRKDRPSDLNGSGFGRAGNQRCAEWTLRPTGRCKRVALVRA
jgi:hypothetical protein